MTPAISKKEVQDFQRKRDHDALEKTVCMINTQLCNYMRFQGTVDASYHRTLKEMYSKEGWICYSDEPHHILIIE